MIGQSISAVVEPTYNVFSGIPILITALNLSVTA